MNWEVLTDCFWAFAVALLGFCLGQPHPVKSPQYPEILGWSTHFCEGKECWTGLTELHSGYEVKFHAYPSPSPYHTGLHSANCPGKTQPILDTSLLCPLVLWD